MHPLVLFMSKTPSLPERWWQKCWQCVWRRIIILSLISWLSVLTINNGVMYRVRIALISIFSIHAEYFRALEVRIFKYLHICSAVCSQKQLMCGEEEKDLQGLRLRRCSQSKGFLRRLEACLGHQWHWSLWWLLRSTPGVYPCTFLLHPEKTNGKGRES